MHSTTFFLTNLSRKRRRNKAKQGIDSHTIHLLLEFIILIPVYVTCNNGILLFPSFNSGWKALFLWPLCMSTSDEQISPPSLVLKMKVCQGVHEWLLKVETVKRMFTPKECKCEEICLQTRLGGEICSSDVIMHKGHFGIYLLFSLT